MYKPISQGNNIVNYENVSKSYLQRRKLQGNLNWFLLCVFGVGGVIAGDFAGWNFGLAAGGFWGLAIATGLMAIMYFCMVYSIAELSSSLPHAGGFYSFTRYAFGPFWGYVCGLAVAIEFIMTTSTLVVAITDYLKPLLPAIPVYLIWLVLYGIFAAINMRDSKLVFYVTMGLTFIAIMVLVAFYTSILMTGVFSPDKLFNIPAEPGQSAAWLPKGWYGVFAAIPFAMWFYLAIEQLPMAAEETENVPKNMPKGLILATIVLIVLSVLTLIINTGVGGGALEIGQSASPLIDGLEAYFGEDSTSTWIATVSLICGLIVSFHAVIYSSSRILFSLSRAGYLPRWISVTNGHHTPVKAIIITAVIGFIAAVIVELTSGTVLRSALLNMAVFGAVISYLCVMLAYIKLKLTRPDLPRPYNSPIGLWGAVVGTVLTLIALAACLSIPDYRPGVWGITLLLIAGVAYFLLYGKNRLVAQAPEERAALKSR